MASSRRNRFSGAYQHTVDTKNRVTVPACWRSEEIREFYAWENRKQGVLKLLTWEERERIGQAVLDKPEIGPEEAKRFRRFLFGSTPECPLDKEGRLVLPAKSLQVLGLGREVLLVGVGEAIEIWDPAKHDLLLAAEREAMCQIGEGVGL